MRVHVADHPLIDHKLSVLRNKETPSPVFRQLADELVTLLAYEATREVHTGLGMLEGMTRLLPTAEVGFLGMSRNEKTLEIETYANRLPQDLSGRQVFVVDPMLATGHTLIAAIEYLLERGAKDVTALFLLAAPEGLKAVEEAVGDRANVTIVVAAVDDHLNENAYIVPGLGDAGDRLYGVVD